jgi:hypothetical protein
MLKYIEKMWRLVFSRRGRNNQKYGVSGLEYLEFVYAKFAPGVEKFLRSEVVVMA